jgi:inorganic pyrophosphatase
MKLEKIKTFEGNLLQVVVETPKGSAYKYDYDPEQEIFCLNKIMPLGLSFPFDFGFIPHTKGEDGDPIDVLVMMELPASQGVLVQCRIIGILEAIQIERDGHRCRNDRVIAVWNLSSQFKAIERVEDLNPELLREMESFFKQYNTLAGKEFISLGWKDSKEALKMIQSQMLS